MRFEELLREERAEGRAEGRTEGLLEGRIISILDVLAEIGEISEELREKIWNEKDVIKLQKWNKIAATVDTVEAFINQM